MVTKLVTIDGFRISLRPPERPLHSPFEDLSLRREVLQLTHPLAVLLDRSLRDQANQLTFHDARPPPFHPPLQVAKDHARRGEPEVRKIHGDLGTSAYQRTQRLDSLQAAAGVPHLPGQGARQSHIRLVQKDVPGDEEPPRPYRAPPGRGMQVRPADVGPPCRVPPRRLPQTLELALP